MQALWVLELLLAGHSRDRALCPWHLARTRILNLGGRRDSETRQPMNKQQQLKILSTPWMSTGVSPYLKPGWGHNFWPLSRSGQVRSKISSTNTWGHLAHLHERAIRLRSREDSSKPLGWGGGGRQPPQRRKEWKSSGPSRPACMYHSPPRFYHSPILTPPSLLSAAGSSSLYTVYRQYSVAKFKTHGASKFCVIIANGDGLQLTSIPNVTMSVQVCPEASQASYPIFKHICKRTKVVETKL